MVTVTVRQLLGNSHPIRVLLVPQIVLVGPVPVPQLVVTIVALPQDNFSNIGPGRIQDLSRCSPEDFEVLLAHFHLC